jgi:predicted GNAT superfamily acetyltransferase
MLAANAYLNLSKLAGIAVSYETDLYGSSSSPLHGGLPTDRLLVEWWIRSVSCEPLREKRGVRPLHDVPAVNATRTTCVWPECVSIDLSCRSDAIRVEIPLGFTRMLHVDRELALEWRLAARSIFTTYLGQGFTAVDFALDRDRGIGSYLLVRGLRRDAENACGSVQ